MYWQRTHLKHQNQDPFLRCCCLWLTQSHGIQYSKYCDNDSSSNIAHRHLSDSHFISLLAILSCSTPAKTSYDWSTDQKHFGSTTSSGHVIADSASLNPFTTLHCEIFRSSYKSELFLWNGWSGKKERRITIHVGIVDTAGAELTAVLLILNFWYLMLTDF